VTLNMKCSSTEIVRRKISPAPLSQTSVTGAAHAKRLAAFHLPGGVGARHVLEAQLARGRPAVEGIVGFRPAGGGEEADDGRVLVQRFVVFAQRKVVDAPATKRDGARQFRRFDVDARGLVQRDFGHVGFGQRGTRGVRTGGRRRKRDFLACRPVLTDWAV
jgi:hypothetical protein